MKRLDLSLEHQVLKSLKDHEPIPQRLLVAVSGGVDSMVAAEILQRWQRYLKCELVIAHFHHGPALEPSVQLYRDRAQALVKEWATKHHPQQQRHQGLTFVTNADSVSTSNPATSPGPSRSEAELRDLRWQQLEQWREEYNCDGIVTGHHRDDLLETRLLRLIRGSGSFGLQAMRVKDGLKLRPLLEVSRQQIVAYAQHLNLQWVEDPSNADADAALRNWLRQQWLPALEERQSGATQSLARSLELLLAKVAENSLTTGEATPRSGTLVVFERAKLQHKDVPSREESVVEYLRTLVPQGYTRGHVREFLKRLDSPRKEYQFVMLGFLFQVTPDLVWASRV